MRASAFGLAAREREHNARARARHARGPGSWYAFAIGAIAGALVTFLICLEVWS